MDLTKLSVEPIFLLVAGILALLALVTVLLKKLTVSAACGAWLLGIVVAMGANLTGLALLGTFFLLGTLATAYRKKEKAAIQGQAYTETRNLKQVLANGGVAGLAAFASLADYERAGLYQLILAGSLASATADTLSSELGMLFGRKFYNVLNFRKEPNGLDGAISLEGSLAGFFGTLLIAAVYAVFEGPGLPLLWIILAGNIGNYIDSLLGASLQRKKLLNNDVVNLFNTLAAALVIWVLVSIAAG
ncbi:MAG: DUF92 domain-containing protein [Candidatus Pseudobacter hemicellulosilyticus]|uniref:DUF92 domain-containing protein n=1 Tax=Candidatus Pseudobacter hemicellulosilyticus TaxID=3121375 RepID=A0AAJ6BI80_9BACT|nr:MAG: DUF92 domain-containing protein [Pseudobacter sp.]